MDNDAARFHAEVMAQQEQLMSNLSLWESVSKTDPRYTKKFKKGGGFEGTAINATWLAQRATETFGPIGIGWGVEVIGQEYAHGAPILHKETGAHIGNEIVHTAHIRLWYVLDGKRGAVEHIGCTTFVGTNKHGAFSDEDHAKKSLTDATTKALSLLGFAADVHLGLFDDNKYVADRRREFSEGSQTRQSAAQDDDESQDEHAHIRAIADACIALHAAAVVKAEKDSDMSGFWELYEKAKDVQGDDRMVLWGMLKMHSPVRAALKEYAELDRKMAEQRKAA